jgi:anti-sigma B factor antagonist
MALTTSTRWAGDVTIVDLSGRIALGDESAALRDLIAGLLADNRKKILLNMADVSYIDSSGLGVLVSAFATVKRAGGELKLLKLSEKVSDLMEITRLYTVFDIEDDEAKAVAAFGHSTAAGA